MQPKQIIDKNKYSNTRMAMPILRERESSDGLLPCQIYLGIHVQRQGLILDLRTASKSCNMLFDSICSFAGQNDACSISSIPFQMLIGGETQASCCSLARHIRRLHHTSSAALDSGLNLRGC